MPFANEIAGAQGSISRPQFKSPNYVAGSAGWALFRDGTAEFASGQFRGAVLIGTSPNPRVSVTTTIPAPLVAFSADFTWTAAIVQYFDGTQFYFEAVGTFTGSGGPFPVHALGAYDTVKGVQLHQLNQGPGSGATTFILGGSDTYNTEQLFWQYRNGTFTLTKTCDLNLQHPSGGIDADFTHGRGTTGVMYWTGGTGAQTGTGGAEVALSAWTSADSVTIMDGHFYSFHVRGGAFSDTTGATEQASVKVRKTVNSTATQILGQTRVLVCAGSNVAGMNWTFYVQNATGADITITPGITVARNSGGGTSKHAIYGDTTVFPLMIRVKDEGLASQTRMQFVATLLV